MSDCRGRNNASRAKKGRESKGEIFFPPSWNFRDITLEARLVSCEAAVVKMLMVALGQLEVREHNSTATFIIKLKQQLQPPTPHSPYNTLMIRQ